ncbi:MAG: amino acid permease [Candidatus Hodarchaeales archaeon]|jgi:amino acid transporter
MALSSELTLGIIIIGISLTIILSLTIYSLIQVIFYGRKRYILKTGEEKGADAILSGADLSRDMTVTQATMTGVGAMIGAGIFVLTGIVAGIAGPALLVAFALNGVVATLIALVYAELGSAMPEAGGGYVWARAGLGETQGFFSGWMSWFAAAVAGSLYALGFGAYFVALLSNIGLEIPSNSVFFLEKVIAILVIVAFLLINQLGSSVMGKAEVWISGAKVIILVFFIVTGIIIMTGNPTQSVNNLNEFFPRGFFSILMAMGFSFIAFEGYEVICQTGEEIYDPKVNIPKAVILSILIVIPIYLFVGLVSLGAFIPPTGGTTTWQFLSDHKELGLLFAAEQMIPGLGLVVILFGGLLSTLSALNAAIYSSTRVAFALGRDGSLPNILGRVSSKYHTPIFSIGVTGILILTIALAIPIDAVAASADLMFMILFGQVLLASVLIRKKVRKSREKLDYGYKTPLFPSIPVAGGIALISIFIFTLFLHIEALVATSLWLLLGAVIYFSFAKKRSPYEIPSKLEKHTKLRADYVPEAFFTTICENILVPMAGKIYEWDAFRIAIHLAHEFGQKLYLYHFGKENEQIFDKYEKILIEFNIPFEILHEHPEKSKTSSQDIVQRLVDVTSTGKYQLAILPSSRNRRFWQRSISHEAIRKMPIPGIEVFPCKNCKPTDHITFSHVGALTPGSRRDPFLLQIGISIVSSTKVSDLVAYHWTEAPRTVTPKVMSEAPGVRENTLDFLHHIGEAIRMGIPIQQRHVLGHDFVRSISDIVRRDNLDLLILGYGRPRLSKRPSEKLVNQVECTSVVFHGRPEFKYKKGTLPSFDK